MEPKRKKRKVPHDVIIDLTDDVSETTSSLRESWLDRLPSEVCVKIAKLLNDAQGRNVSEPPTLSLAIVSKRQYAAVVEATQQSVVIQNSRIASRWYQVFAPDIRSVDLVSISRCPSLTLILGCPKLYSARISLDLEHLDGITGSRSLRELTIYHENRIRRSQARTMQKDRLKHFRRALQSLQLTKLHLECEAIRDGRPCLLAELAFPRDGIYLGSICPGVSDFAVAVGCERGDHVDPYYAMHNALHTTTSFTMLREVTIFGPLKIPQEGFAKLKLLQSVRLIDLPVYDVGKASQLGASLKTLRFKSGIDTGQYLSADDVEQLAPCTKVTDLEAYLELRAERELLTICKNVQSLRLTWRHSNMDLYYTPKPAIIEGLIFGSSKLETLHLYRLNLSRAQLTNVFERMSGRLTNFGISDSGNGELPCERLAFVLAKLAACNRNLRELHVKQQGRPRVAVGPEVVEELMAGLSLLRKRSLLDGQRVEELIKDYASYNGSTQYYASSSSMGFGND